MKVTIIGGAGGMGRWFSNFFKLNDVDVMIVDKSEKTEEIAKEMNVQFLKFDVLKEEEEEEEGKEGEGKEEIVDTDVMVISVPIDITASVIERVGPEMHEGSLLMDIASVKRKPMESMKRFTKEGVEILGTHPLFGPTAKSMQGQSIIFVPLREGRLYEEIYEMFRRNGARIEFLDAEKHDEIMSVVQGLTHFILISFGITLRDLNFDVEASRKFMSPTCEMLMDFVGRILHQDSHLYALIQTNLEMGKIDEAFLSVVNKLYELISDKKVNEFMEEMRTAKKHFGDTEKAMINSDKVIEKKIKDKWKNM